MSGLGYVLPPFTLADAANRLMVDAIQCCEFFISRVARPNVGNCFLGQLGAPMAVAACGAFGFCVAAATLAAWGLAGLRVVAVACAHCWIVGRRTAALTHPVTRVVCRRSDEQVIGADATGVIAMVANMQSFGDRPVGNLICHTMSSEFNPIEIDFAVPFGALCASPDPASSGTVNSAVESPEKLRAILVGHSGLLSRVWGAMLRAVAPAPGLSAALNYTAIGVQR